MKSSFFVAFAVVLAARPAERRARARDGERPLHGP